MPQYYGSLMIILFYEKIHLSFASSHLPFTLTMVCFQWHNKPITTKGRIMLKVLSARPVCLREYHIGIV